VTYNEAKIEFLYFNGKNEDIQICAALDDDTGALEQSDIIAQMDRKITEHELAIQKIKDQKQFFLNKFATYWTPVASVV
jgi:hypothetical protein